MSWPDEQLSQLRARLGSVSEQLQDAQAKVQALKDEKADLQAKIGDVQAFLTFKGGRP